MQKLLSLCIATTGVTEWVDKVVESIYSQNEDDALFEVIITDNGDNDDCMLFITKKFSAHKNLHYKRTSAKLFLNQIEAFKLASGLFIKLINTRSVFTPGSMRYFLDFIRKHQADKEKPVVYFLNHLLEREPWACKSFNDFVASLSNISSWSGGLSCWKEDFDKLPQNMEYNILFPHLSILFYFTDKQNYIIDYRHWFDEIEINCSQKSKYNVYYAFGLQYLSLLLDLANKNKISFETFLQIKKVNENFITNDYKKFTLQNQPHSFELEHAKEYFNVFYDFEKIRLSAETQLKAEKHDELSKNCKRVAIFASYFSSENVPDYIFYYLRGLKEVCDKIIFIADNFTSSTEIAKLKNYVSYVQCERHNEYDFGSYKRGIAYAENNGLLTNADELILCNDSCYGPVFPFADMFREMEKRKCDFWGICKNVDIEEHLQSYFLVFKKQIFSDSSFHEFFANVTHQPSREDTILKYETKLTHYFTNKGYSFANYIPYPEEDNMYPRSINMNLTCFPTWLMHRKCPLLKVKAFYDPTANCEGIKNSLHNLWEKNEELHSLVKNDSEKRMIKIETHKQSYKLFNIISLFSVKKCGEKTVYKIFGLPIWKIRHMKNNITTKYYLFDIPFLKISKK